MGCTGEVGHNVTVCSLHIPAAISHVCHVTGSPVPQITPYAVKAVAAPSTGGAGPSSANAHDRLACGTASWGVLAQPSIPQQPRPWAVDTGCQGGVSRMDGTLLARDCAQIAIQQQQQQLDMSHNVSAAPHAQLAANDVCKLPQGPLLVRAGVSDTEQRRARDRQIIQSFTALVRDAVASGVNLLLPNRGNLQGMTMVLQGWEQHDRGGNSGAYPEEDLAFDAEYSSFIVRHGSIRVDECTAGPSNPHLNPGFLGAAADVAATCLGTSSKAAAGYTAQTQLPAGKVGQFGNGLMSGHVRSGPPCSC